MLLTRGLDVDPHTDVIHGYDIPRNSHGGTYKCRECSVSVFLCEIICYSEKKCVMMLVDHTVLSPGP